MSSIIEQLKSATISTNEKIDRAIKKINPTASFAITDSSIDKITWSTGTTPISKSDIEAKYAEVEAEWNATKYIEIRALSYPDIGDQLDDLYKKGAFSTDMAAKIKKVKDDNPKP